MFCSAVRCCKEEQDTIVGTSTNCSTLRGRRHAERCGIGSREIVGTAKPARQAAACRSSAAHPPPDSPYAAQAHRGSARKARCQRCAPLRPRLWPHLNERCGPGGKHIPIVVQSKVHRTCRPGRRSLLARGVVHLALLLPAPGHALSPQGGVVFVRGQEHLQRELLMPPVHPQPALAASSRCSLSVCNINVRPQKSTCEVNTKKKKVDFFSLMVVGKMCVFVSRPKESVTLHQKNGDLLKLVVDFLRENTFRWKSSRMSTKKVTTTTANPRNRRRFCVRRQNPHKSSEISRLFSSIFIFHCYFSIFAFFHFPFFTFIVSFLFFLSFSFSLSFFFSRVLKIFFFTQWRH